MKRTILMCAAAAILASATAAQAQPNPNEVYVQSITYGGSGCPNGTVAQTISNDRTVFTLIFDQFIASTGPSIPINDARKNCQVSVNLHVPQGFQFSIGSMDYRGFVQLAAGHKAEHKAVYFFAGSPLQVVKKARFEGPVSKDYLQSDQLPFSTVVWSECGAVAPVNINTQVAIDPSDDPGAKSQMTTDSIDGKVRTILSLQWRSC